MSFLSRALRGAFFTTEPLSPLIYYTMYIKGLLRAIEEEGGGRDVQHRGGIGIPMTDSC